MFFYSNVLEMSDIELPYVFVKDIAYGCKCDLGKYVGPLLVLVCVHCCPSRGVWRLMMICSLQVSIDHPSNLCSD